MLIFDKAFKLFVSDRVAQFSQRLSFYLPDPLPGNIKILTYFLEGMICFFSNTKAQP